MSSTKGWVNPHSSFPPTTSGRVCFTGVGITGFHFERVVRVLWGRGGLGKPVLTIAAAATQICFPSREGCLDYNCATAFIISGRVCFEGVGATVFHHRGCVCVARVRATVFHRLGARELCGCWGDGFPPRRGRVFCRCWGVVGGGILVSGEVLYASVKPPPPCSFAVCCTSCGPSQEWEPAHGRFYSKNATF